MDLQKLFDWFGGKKRTAEALGVDAAAVSQWIKWGYVPPANALKIERITHGEFKAIDLSKR